MASLQHQPMRSPTACLAIACLLASPPLLARVSKYEAVAVDSAPFDKAGERSLHSSQPSSQGTSGPSDWADSAPTPPAPIPTGPAYGPFRVLDATRVALVDVTDGRTPGLFAAMLRDHPGIRTIEMVECPGTEDDLANLKLGQMIREHGISTHVPAGGSVRSGGVELFVAGTHRSADPGAEFAVHSWIDDTGHEPDDYAPTAPENRRYVDYYRQMGMTPAEAEAFYAMTNSVPFSSARWFGASEMGGWIRLGQAGIGEVH